MKPSFLDIGCASGVKSCLTQWNDPLDPRLLSIFFEFFGVDGNKAEIEKLQNQNNLYKRLIYTGISDVNGERNLFITKMEGCSSILEPDFELIGKNLTTGNEIDWFKIKREETIRTITIDDLCQKYNIQPSVLKIDIQGAEMLALQGAKKTLENCCIVIAETSTLAFYKNQSITIYI